MTDPKNQLFDFNEPIYSSEQPFEDFVNEVESSVEKAPYHSSKVNFKSLLMVVLTLNLIGLGVFGFLYADKTKISKNTEFAGVPQNFEPKITSEKMLSGEGFSITYSKKIPDGYIKSSEKMSFTYLDNQPGTVTHFLITDSINNKPIKSGFDVYQSENNSKYNLQEFANRVKASLGNDYVLDSNPVSLAKSQTAQKITYTKDPNIVTYVTTTPSNYFVIQVYNQTKGNDKFDDYTKFIDEIPANIFLN
jgi:hypothetical protein